MKSAHQTVSARATTPHSRTGGTCVTAESGPHTWRLNHTRSLWRRLAAVTQVPPVRERSSAVLIRVHWCSFVVFLLHRFNSVSSASQGAPQKSSTLAQACAHIPIVIIKPKMRGFVCVTAHPEGCAAHVQEQIDYVRARGPIDGMPRRVLVIGASTGYGLASRIVPAFAGNAATIGVFFEKTRRRRTHRQRGMVQFRGVRKGRSRRRTLREEHQWRRVLRCDQGAGRSRRSKPISGRWTPLFTASPLRAARTRRLASFTNRRSSRSARRSRAKTVDTDKGTRQRMTIEPATEEEIADTIAVMGGEDWEMWIDALVLSGRAGEGAFDRRLQLHRAGLDVGDLSQRHDRPGQGGPRSDRAPARRQSSRSTGGRALVSINKALVTQASSAIPVVPLYISLLYKVMKANGTHEGCIEQIYRLFAERLAKGAIRQSTRPAACGSTIGKCGTMCSRTWRALAAGHDRKSSHHFRYRRLSLRVSPPLRIWFERDRLRSRDRPGRAAPVGRRLNSISV